jgi:hypothetical protein
MEPAADAGRLPAPPTFDIVSDDAPPRWRVAVDVEFVLEAEDREAAILQAEDLCQRVRPAGALPRRARVEVVMSLPVRVPSDPETSPRS